MKQILFFFLMFCACFSGYSQETFMYRLILKDKGNPPFSTEQPESFLSGKSILRRAKQGLPVDSIDLPIDPAYLQAIAHTGADIRACSKWVKTVVVHIPDLSLVATLNELPFVDTLYGVWRGSLPQQVVFSNTDPASPNTLNSNPDNYGEGFIQIGLNNGQRLHDAGFHGRGMTIAVIDGGFANVDRIDCFDSRRIKGVKDFNHEANDPLRGIDHGTKVLSCMLSDKPGTLIGTAPEADYYLLRTEVDDEEYPVEEDYWVAALEYADSIGVDIVTSSLGYADFDDSSMDHTHGQLDGQSIPVSVAANLAASRGILLFNSAGNEGDGQWKKIMFPGDARNILTIGAVSSDSVRSYFSSEGPTADGRVKPDLMAMGTTAVVMDSNGQTTRRNGTSYATPILAGLGACLWQALPDLTALDVVALLRETAHAFSQPDSLMGYGIADVYKAYTHSQTGLKPIGTDDAAGFSIHPRDNRLYLNPDQSPHRSRLLLDIYSGVGVKWLSVSTAASSIDVAFLPRGVYIARLQMDGKPAYVRKFIKL
jgi:subtilisin family serine protease